MGLGSWAGDRGSSEKTTFQYPPTVAFKKSLNIKIARDIDIQNLKKITERETVNKRHHWKNNILVILLFSFMIDKLFPYMLNFQNRMLTPDYKL